MASNTPGKGSFSRRTFVKTVGATGVAAGLAGCGGNSGNGTSTGGTSSSGGSNGATSIQFAGSTRDKKNQAAINKALHKAGLSKDVSLNILGGSSVTNNRESKYTQWLSAGRSEPDLLLMDSGWTVPFIARNQLADLTKALPKGILNTVKNNYFSASVKTAMGQNGHLYGIPLFPDFPTMLYRKDLFKNAGHNPQSNWATKSIHWKKFSKAVADAKKQSGVNYGYTWQAKVYEGLSCCDFNELMSSWGGAYFGGTKNLFGPIGNRPITVDQQPVINAIKMAKTFIDGPNASNTLSGYKQISPQAVLQWTENPSLKPFQNGNAVATRNWSYAIKQSAQSSAVGHKKLGVMPIPYHIKQGGGKYPQLGGPTAALGGWNVALNPNSQKTNAAIEVLKTITSDTFQLGYTKATGNLVPKPKLFNSKEMKNLPHLGPYMNQLKVAGNNAIPRPVTAVWPQESTKISQEVNAALSGSKTPKNAMSSLKKSLKAVENSA